MKDRLPNKVQDWLAQGGNQPEGMSAGEFNALIGSLSRNPSLSETSSWLKTHWDEMSPVMRVMTLTFIFAGSAALLSGCIGGMDTDGDDSPEDGDNTLLGPEHSISPAPSHSIMDTPHIAPVPATPTPDIATPTPTPEPEICILDPQTELFRDASTGLTVPVLSARGANEIFGEEIPLTDILGQVAFEVEQIHRSNPQNISNVIIPEYLNPADVRDYLEGDGIANTSFDIQRYDPNANINNENNLLVSVHAGEEGWTTALWRNPSLSQRPDASFMIDGELMLTVDTDKDGNPELRTLPAQRIGDTKPDIAIVDGCEPSIIRVTPDGNTQAILAQDPDLLNPDSLWVQNNEIPLPTPTPDAQTVIANLISEFNLNPQRQYEMLTSEGKQYLVDTFNQAKMAKLEGGNWVDTTTEEKYGHLLLEDEITPVSKAWGNLFFDSDNPFYDGLDQRYELIHFCARSTGNFWSEEEVIDNISPDENKFNVVYGEFVHRNIDGKIILLPVRVDVLDKASSEWGGVQFTFQYQEKYCSTSGGVYFKARDSEEIASYYQPGTLVEITFTYNRPDIMPTPSDRYFRKAQGDDPGWGLSNIRSRANYLLWNEDKKKLELIADQLSTGSEVNLPPGFLPADFVRPIFSSFQEFNEEGFPPAWK